jgi:hypothetical protein
MKQRDTFQMSINRATTMVMVWIITMATTDTMSIQEHQVLHLLWCGMLVGSLKP